MFSLKEVDVVCCQYRPVGQSSNLRCLCQEKSLAVCSALAFLKPGSLTSCCKQVVGSGTFFKTMLQHKVFFGPIHGDSLRGFKDL